MFFQYHSCVINSKNSEMRKRWENRRNFLEENERVCLMTTTGSPVSFRAARGFLN